MRSKVFAAVLVALILGGLYWILPHSESPRADGDAFDVDLRVSEPWTLEPLASKDETPAPIDPPARSPVATSKDLAASPENSDDVYTLTVLSEGRPAAGAVVSLCPANHSEEGSRPFERTITDTDGRCTFPRQWDRVLAHATLGAAESQIREMSPFRPDAVIDLIGPGSVHGRVLDGSGRPVAGAEVVFRAAYSADIESQLGRAEPRLQTDLSGELWVQLPARWSLAHVEATAGEESVESVVQISPGRLSEMTLRFPGDYRVKGRVLTADGTPVPWPSITAVQLLEDGSEQIWVSGGDPKGEFELDLPTPGRVRVLASKDAMGAGREEVVLTVDRRTATLEVTLPVAGEVTGRLLHEDGSPIAGIPIRCIPVLPNAIDETLDSNVRIGELLRDSSARSDAEGRFRLASVSLEYDFVLWCRPVAETPEREMYHGPVRGGDHVELVVSEMAMRGGIIRGTVEVAETGEAPDYFEVGVIEERPIQWAGSKPTLEVKLPFREGDGNLEIDQLVPGRSYYLNVTGPDFGVTVVGPIEAGSGVVVPIQLRAQSRLELQVIAPSGGPARNASVQLAHWPPFLEDGVRKGIADLDGQLALDFVSAGLYRVTVTFAGRTYRPEDFRVPAGETYEHALRLSASMEER